VFYTEPLIPEVQNRLKNQVSRRRFLKEAAVAAPGIAAASVLHAQTQGSAALPRKWDKEVDVVVVGSGFAGLATALTVKDAGGSVLILEKMPQKHEGGNRGHWMRSITTSCGFTVAV